MSSISSPINLRRGQSIASFKDGAKSVDPEFDIKKVDGDTNEEPGDFTKAENNELLEEDIDL